MAEDQRQDDRHGQRNDNHDQWIDHESLEPRPDRIGPMIVICQHGEHTGEIIATSADLYHAAIELRHVTPGNRFFYGRTSSEIGLELPDLRLEPAVAHTL